MIFGVNGWPEWWGGTLIRIIENWQIWWCYTQVEHLEEAVTTQQVVRIEICNSSIFIRYIVGIQTLWLSTTVRTVWSYNVRAYPVIRIDQTQTRTADELTGTGLVIRSKLIWIWAEPRNLPFRISGVRWIRRGGIDDNRRVCKRGHHWGDLAAVDAWQKKNIGIGCQASNVHPIKHPAWDGEGTNQPTFNIDIVICTIVANFREPSCCSRETAFCTESRNVVLIPQVIVNRSRHPEKICITRNCFIERFETIKTDVESARKQWRVNSWVKTRLSWYLRNMSAMSRVLWCGGLGRFVLSKPSRGQVLKSIPPSR